MNFSRPLILASSSPRRQYLLKEAGYDYRILLPDTDESFSPDMPAQEVPAFLAEKKARSLSDRLSGEEILITADTVVILGNQILNKPADRQEAIDMLTSLSGETHTVITAVCLLSREKMDTFDDRTEVTFKSLSKPEIEFYIDAYRPYDKAGSYGAQDWLGMVGIEKINGSYFTVMGLPMHRLYERLNQF